MKSIKRIVAVSALVVMASSAGFAAEEGAATAMDPAMMEKVMALTSPSEAHKVLEPFVGTFTYAGSFWMSPDAPPEAMTGSGKFTMIYGGRFLKQEFEGPWMGQPFHGTGFTGFDNVRGEYVSIWFDNMSTGIMTVTGQYDPETKTLTQSGANSCPMTGDKARAGRSEWTQVDPDHHTYTSYSSGPDGKEFKSMEVTYTRIP